MSSAKWAQIEADGNMKSAAYQPQLPVTYQPQRPWNFFEWDDSWTERQQSSDYLRQLKEYVDVMPTDHGFSDVVVDDGFFNFLIFGRDFVGTTDVAITARSSAYIYPASGLRFVMQLKKHPNPDKGLHCAQGY